MGTGKPWVHFWLREGIRLVGLKQPRIISITQPILSRIIRAKGKVEEERQRKKAPGTSKSILLVFPRTNVMKKCPLGPRVNQRTSRFPQILAARA